MAIKKIDGDMRICGDYKIAVNHQTYSDSFPLPSIETACYELANIKTLCENRFKVGLQPDRNRRQILRNYPTKRIVMVSFAFWS